MSTEAPFEVEIHTAQGELEAHLVRSLLENAGIPCRTQGESLRLTHMFSVDGLGAVRFFVAPEHAARAAEILAALDQGALSLQDDDVPGEGTPRERWKELS
jgi:hypothetical protein